MYKFYLPPTRPELGWYFFIRDGLQDHPNTQIVESPELADYIIVGLYSQFDLNSIDDPQRIIIVDYADVSARIIPASNCFLYFKRSVFDKPTGNLFANQVIPIAFPMKKDFVLGRPRNIGKDRKFDLACFFETSYADISWNKNRARVAEYLGNRFAKTKYKTHFGHIGNTGNVGRSTIQSDYQRALCESKIVVTCNPDTWEGDHRLFEALSGGALVMVDEMKTPMQNPLIHKEHLIYYDLNDLDSLFDQCIYYLENEAQRLNIAARGFVHGFTHHSYVHRIQQIVTAIDNKRAS